MGKAVLLRAVFFVEKERTLTKMEEKNLSLLEKVALSNKENEKQKYFVVESASLTQRNSEKDRLC